MKFLYGVYETPEAFVNAYAGCQNKQHIKATPGPYIPALGYILVAECQCPDPVIPQIQGLMKAARASHLPTCPEYDRQVIGGNPAS